MRHWQPRIATPSSSALDGRRRADRRARPRAALVDAVDRALRASCSRRRSPGAPRPASSSAGARSRDSSRSSPTAFAVADAHVVFTAHSLPGADPRRRATRTRTSCWRRRGSSPKRPAIDDWSFSFQSASPTGEPWLGPDILDHLAELHARGVTQRAPLSSRLRLGPPRDPLGPRRRGGGRTRASSG